MKPDLLTAAKAADDEFVCIGVTDDAGWIYPNPPEPGVQIFVRKNMSNNLKEMLQLAAKAAGIDRLQVADHGYIAWIGGTPKNWNPATDDGDSARLRTALDIFVSWSRRENVYLYVTNKHGVIILDVIERFSDHNGDKNAALRWATLRLAAEIGRRMP